MQTDNPMIKHIHELCSDILTSILASQRYTLWQKECKELPDLEFLTLGIMRALDNVDSGRHFLQQLEEVYDITCAHSTYFAAIHSKRRLGMIKDVEPKMYSYFNNLLNSKGVDYLDEFKELNGYSVEAADGHFIDHAYHTEKNEKGKFFAAGFIYAMNLRNGLLRPLCVVTNGTHKSHEMPHFRAYIKATNTEFSGTQSQKKLFVYDKAITDYSWWEFEKSNGNFMISRLKDNAIIDSSVDIPFDVNDEINVGIEKYALCTKGSAIFCLVTYRDPETNNVFNFITTMPKTIRPGLISLLYFKRWTIEKAFNNSKSDLKEKKAWSSDLNSLNIQMRFTTMAYNMARVLEETIKVENQDQESVAEHKYQKALATRDVEARAKGCFVNPMLFKKRISRITASTIRCLQNILNTGKALVVLVRLVTGRLILSRLRT